MKPPKNLPASVRQRLLNESKQRGTSFDYIASLYARERFLARLATSPHKDRLILKGATVFMLWLDAPRATRDLDFLGLGEFTPEAAVAITREILEVEMDDGLLFDATSVTAEAIRDHDEYHGVRVHLTARLDTARIRVQLDIAVGDIVTPAARHASLPVVLDSFSAPRIKVYPPETIIAEKLHAMVKLGVANSRMKDFFDVYVLSQERSFDGELLVKAVTRTFRRRKTAVPATPFALTEEFYRDRQRQTQWRAFLRKSDVKAPEDFGEIGKRLRVFLRPLLQSIENGVGGPGTWKSPRWRNLA